MKRLEDKVAIVTGSGAGIGKEIAKTYAKEGAKVIIADFNEAALNETVKEISDDGYDAFGVVINVAKEADVDKMFDETIEKYGKIDIVVNNAGVGDNMQGAANVEDNVWERVMSINVDGVMRITRRAVNLFLEQGGGTIVNMASISGVTGGRGGFTYTAAKHAVVGMTKNVASQYGVDNIRCNAIAPGQIDTGFAASMDNVDQTGMKSAIRGVNLVPKSGEVKDVANIALFLASDESSYINGVVLTADDGWSAY